MITIQARSAVSVPNPPVGKKRIFLDDSDFEVKVKDENGAIVSLEEAALGGSGNAVDISYNTTDANFWLFAVSVPTNVRDALDALAEKVNEIDQTIGDLTPEKADELGNLTILGTTFYSGKLPSGLSTEWYNQFPAGSVINNVIYDPIFTVSAEDFRAGRKDAPPSYGILSEIINGVTGDSHDMTTGVGQTGDVEVTDISPFNNFWAAADGRIFLDFTGSEGFNDVVMSHTEAGDSNPVELHYDDTSILPSFNTALNVVEQSKNSKWLSGVEYYGINSSFLVSYTVTNLFRKVYRSAGATVLQFPAAPNQNIDPSTTPNYLDSFTVTNEPVSMVTPNVSINAPSAQVIARKPNNNNAANSSFDFISGLGLAVNTYGIVSTPTAEFFQDEDKRLVSGTNTAFDSTATLTNGEALVRNGVLSYGTSIYTGKTGPQRYERKYSLATANNGTIEFEGLGASNIDGFGTGDLNVLILLENQNLYFDLGRAFGDNAGLGGSESTAFGARVSINGDQLSFSLGTNSTALNNNEFRLIVIFRNANHSISGINIV